MEGWGDVHRGAVSADSSGLSCRGDERAGSGSGVRGAPRDGEEDAAVLDPAGVPEAGERVRSKLGPYTGVIERILEEDKTRPVKQRHTALRIYQRLRDEHGFTGGYPSQRATDSGAGSEDGSGTLFSLPVHERSGGNQPLDLREAIGGTWPPDRRSIFERGGVP